MPNSYGFNKAADLVRHKEDARLLCEMIAESAAHDRRFGKRTTYQTLRLLDPLDLFEVYEAWRRGKDDLVEAIIPHYAQTLGMREEELRGKVTKEADTSPEIGPLFEHEDAEL